MSDTTDSPGVTIVAGGASGIGRDIAVRLAATGATVAVLDAPAQPPRTVDYPLASTADLDAVVAELQAAGAKAGGIGVDVRSREQVDAAVREVEDSLGQVRQLVVASGLVVRRNAIDLTDDDWDEVVDTNLHGFFNLARRVLPGMTSRGDGRIVALVGDEGRRGMAGQSHLAAASWAVIGLAKSIALESAAAGVAVNVVCAGPSESRVHSSAALLGQFDTDPAEALALKHPNGKAWVSADEVADAVLFLLSAPGTAMTGSVLDVSNGMSALNSA